MENEQESKKKETLPLRLHAADRTDSKGPDIESVGITSSKKTLKSKMMTLDPMPLNSELKGEAGDRSARSSQREEIATDRRIL